MASHFERVWTGELPSRELLRTDRAAAILADRPINPGHCVVYPAQFVDGWREASPEVIAEVFALARQVAAAIEAEVKPKRVALAIVGVTVAHLHLHLVPVTVPEDLDFGKQRDLPPSELDAIAARLRVRLKAR